MKLMQEANSLVHKDIVLERQQTAQANQRMTQLSAQLTVELDQDSARKENPNRKQYQNRVIRLNQVREFEKEYDVRRRADVTCLETT